MTQELAEQRDQRPTQRHPFDYYWRPGAQPRPAPPRIRFEDIWTHARRIQLTGWIDFHDVPEQTAATRLFMDHEWQGDELMDAVVARFREIGMGEGRKMFEQALAQGIGSVKGAPHELVALFEQIDNPPDWHDAAVVERGRQLWLDASFVGKLGMVVGDFFGTFVGDEVAYATGETGRFVNDFGRRGLETNAWFHSITIKNGLERHAGPFKDVLRLRLMHAQARAGLRSRWGDEQFAHHGNPISAAMVMTAALTFGLIPLLLDHAHGRKRTWQDLAEVTAYWSYIAHLLGVPAELIPKEPVEALEVMDYVVAHAGGPSEWTDVQIGAAVNGAGARARLKQALLSPFLGAFAYYGGAPMVRAMMSGTDMRGARFERWTPGYRVFAYANVGLRRVLDTLPGARWRAERRRSDWFWRGGVQVGKLAAKLHGVRHSGYSYHDGTAAAGLAPGCPVKR